MLKNKKTKNTKCEEEGNSETKNVTDLKNSKCDNSKS